jgi:hypothetical protein
VRTAKVAMPALVATDLRRNPRRDSASIGKSPVYRCRPSAPGIGMEHAYEYLNISYPVPMQRFTVEPSNQIDPFKDSRPDRVRWGRTGRAIGVEVLLGW